MKIRLIQIDGALPNIALMKLAHWFRSEGHSVNLTRRILPDLFESKYDAVYASSIFDFSDGRRRMAQQEWPEMVMGGTGTKTFKTIEEVVGRNPYESYDYADYPEFTASIGFTQRGCRLACKFCVVPLKEGKPKSVNTIADIWRGEPYPKHLHLLDNDFFGQPEWRERLQEIRDGDFRICLSQGINVRMVTPEVAEALKTIKYRDTKFSRPVLYTAWDNIGDEKIFFNGVDTLEAAGIPAKHLRAYMLIGFDKKETWDRIWHRFNRMVERGIEPYPMVYESQPRRPALLSEMGDYWHLSLRELGSV